ncbi:MAG: hypothetical protein KGL04_00750, partial [Elusimicrobia bacterium]|nr:hypothetical protein [Elusimicrobiota bacterium]
MSKVAILNPRWTLYPRGEDSAWSVQMEQIPGFKRMGGMETQTCRPSGVPNREFWTELRLIAVLSAFGLWLYWRTSFGSAFFLYAKGCTLIIFFLFCLIGLLSVNLARLYVSLLILPIHAAIALNRWLFESAYWTFRTVLRLFYMRRVSAFIAF